MVHLQCQCPGLLLIATTSETFLEGRGLQRGNEGGGGREARTHSPFTSILEGNRIHSVATIDALAPVGEQSTSIYEHHDEIVSCWSGKGVQAFPGYIMTWID